MNWIMFVYLYVCVQCVCECIHVYTGVCVHMCLYLSLHWVYEFVSFCVCLCELVCMCALDRCPWVYHAPALGPINVSQLCPGLWAPEFCCFSLFPYFAAVDTGVQSTLPASFQTQPYTRRLGLLWSGCHWTEFFCGGRSQPSSQGSPWSLI